jgi:hypothetical protein
MREVEPDDLILVVIINSPRDLEIARVLGWYRIPVKTAPKTLQVDWIAFYHTAAFGEEKWSVRYIAPVRGYELCRRIDLLKDEIDHPQAGEPYLKVQVGPLKALADPILSRKWRRFTFLYTTGEQMRNARDVADLRISKASIRDILWRSPRERISG